MHYIHVHKLPLPVVQKQVGHKTLKATSVYLNPSEETVAQAYEQVRPAAALVGRLAREAP
jgi:site-specific recombinase XerD